MRRAARPAVLVIVVWLGACGTDRPAPHELPRATFDATDLSALGPCPSPPAGSGETPPPGAVLPADALISDVREQPPLTLVDGYAPHPPVVIRAELEARPGTTLITSEDEVVETELLLQSGRVRTYVKATAVCARGSTFTAVAGPAAGGVPTPTGQPSP